MEIFSTSEFDRDYKRATKEDIKRIGEAIGQIKASNFIGKDFVGKHLHHAKDTYSIRIGNKRMVYHVEKEDSRILLLFFKSREGVYDYLK